MPIQQYPKFKAVPDKLLEIPNPAIGGINLRDLEYEQEVNQSPYMLNVMYRNGAFGKRFGQEVHSTYADTVYSTIYFDGSIFVHAGTQIYKNTEGTISSVGSGFPESSGIFIVYAQKLYYLISSGFYVYDTTFITVDAYVPDLLINCKPDGSHSDSVDEFNLMSDYFSLIYNGDGTSDHYKVGEYDPNNVIDWDTTPTIEVDDTETSAFTVDKTNKEIVFTTPPSEGDINVKMTFKMKAGTFSTERSQILSCKYYDTFGGANNSRLFIAGCGYSKYFFTQSYDISYFPESNFATLGNTEDDITGFGRQYNVLIVFKPREVYSVVSYIENTSTTVIEENIGLESFKSQLVNARIGCDAPHSIQLVNNLLTWFNSKEGICTLTSTNIQDERNIRVISRNVDYTNNFGVKGIMDYTEDLTTIQSADYENKYFLVFPSSGMCFMWDYEIVPYVVTSRGETDPKQLCWFMFSNFYVKQFLKVGKNLLYISNKQGRSVSTLQMLDLDEDNWDSNYNMVYSISDGVTFATVPAHLRAFLEKSITGNSSKSYYFSIEVKFDNYYAPSYIYLNDDVIFTLAPNYTVQDYVKYEGYITLQDGTNTLRIGSLSDPIMNNRKFYFKNLMLFEMNEEIPHRYLDPTIESYVPYETVTQIKLGDFKGCLIKLNSSFVDLDYDGDGEDDAIESFYMTPFFQFGAVEMLKNVTNIYIQCRGDVNSKINISYYTNDSATPEPDLDPISVGGKGVFWKTFNWNNLVWEINSWGNTFRRKCNLKKVQMASVYFDNNEDCDMSITHIGMQYQLVKYVR